MYFYGLAITVYATQFLRLLQKVKISFRDNYIEFINLIISTFVFRICLSCS